MVAMLAYDKKDDQPGQLSTKIFISRPRSTVTVRDLNSASQSPIQGVGHIPVENR